MNIKYKLRELHVARIGAYKIALLRASQPEVDETMNFLLLLALKQ